MILSCLFIFAAAGFESRQNEAQPAAQFVFDHAFRHVHSDGDLLLRQSFDLAQDQNSAASIRQIGDELLHARQIVTRADDALGRQQIAFAGDVFDVDEGVDVDQFGAPKLIDQDVADCLEEIGARLFDGGQVLDGPNPAIGLLNDVVGIQLAAQARAQPIADFRLVGQEVGAQPSQPAAVVAV